MKNEFQEYVIDMFMSTICMCKEKKFSKKVFLSHGSKQTLKAGLITHYPSMYKLGESYKNLWQNTNIEFYSPLLMSENAYQIYINNKGSYMKYKEDNKGKNEQLLYWEHITPNEVVWNRILKVFDDYMADIISDSNVLKERITNCFYGHRLLMITKKEELMLDQTGGRTGKKITAYNNQDLSNVNIAEKRIHCLLTQCDVKSLRLNGQKFKMSEIIDDNYNFVGLIKDYFTNSSFVIREQ